MGFIKTFGKDGKPDYFKYELESQPCRGVAKICFKTKFVNQKDGNWFDFKVAPAAEGYIKVTDMFDTPDHDTHQLMFQGQGLPEAQDLAKLHPENKANYQWLAEDEQASQNPVTVGPGLLKTYTGTYGPRKVYLDNGQLYYHREGDIPYLLLPLSSDLFRFAETDDIRIRFVSVNGKVNSMQIIYRDGTSKMVQKDK